jgi:hypothetical protein
VVVRYHYARTRLIGWPPESPGEHGGSG